jgi:hypothetical protein
MKISKSNVSIACGIALVAIILALPGQMHGQTAAAKSSAGDGTSATHWNIQVDQVDSGSLDLAYSFQIAIYENLVEELKGKAIPAGVPRRRPEGQRSCKFAGAQDNCGESTRLAAKPSVR